MNHIAAAIVIMGAAIRADYDNDQVIPKTVKSITCQPKVPGQFHTAAFIGVALAEAVPILEVVITSILVFAV